MQRLVEMPGDVFRARHHRGVFGDAPHHRDDFALLVAQLAQTRHRHGGQAGGALDLAGDDDHRYRIGPSAEDAVHRVDATGTGGDIQNRWRVGDARVSFSRHGGSLFVVEEYGRQARLVT